MVTAHDDVVMTLRHRPPSRASDLPEAGAAAAGPTTVGVRELKASLSEHLRRVASGESIVVTDRGRAVARLVPVDFSEGLLRLLRERRIRWSGRKPDLTKLPAVRLRGSGKTLSDYVIEGRHED